MTQAPPPPYYQPLPPLNPQSQVISPSTIYITPMNLQLQVGSGPSRLRCPNCHADIVTQTKHKSGCLTWAICGSICAIGLFAPCAWLGCKLTLKTLFNAKIILLIVSNLFPKKGQLIPFCIDSTKDVQHYCSNCRAYIGTFDRMK
jgi:lipopolysaccharide-induced tumor necrosis factor-alpha factor